MHNYAQIASLLPNALKEWTPIVTNAADMRLAVASQLRERAARRKDISDPAEHAIQDQEPCSPNLAAYPEIPADHGDDTGEAVAEAEREPMQPTAGLTRQALNKPPPFEQEPKKRKTSKPLTKRPGAASRSRGKGTAARPPGAQSAAAQQPHNPNMAYRSSPHTQPSQPAFSQPPNLLSSSCLPPVQPPSPHPL